MGRGGAASTENTTRLEPPAGESWTFLKEGLCLGPVLPLSANAPPALPSPRLLTGLLREQHLWGELPHHEAQVHESPCCWKRLGAVGSAKGQGQPSRHPRAVPAAPLLAPASLRCHGYGSSDPRQEGAACSGLPHQDPGLYHNLRDSAVARLTEKEGCCVPLLLGTGREQRTHETTRWFSATGNWRACRAAGPEVCVGLGLGRASQWERLAAKRVEPGARGGAADSWQSEGPAGT